jgi:hypothetical protein
MRRREFIILGGGVPIAALLPPAVRALAQQTGKIPRVGMLSPASSETAGTLAAFRRGIRDLGYVEGTGRINFGADWNWGRFIQEETSWC